MSTKIDDFDECTEMGDGNKKLMAICDARGATRLTELFAEKAVVVNTDAGAFYRNSSGMAHHSLGVAGAESSSDFYASWQDHEARTSRVDAAVRGSGGAAKLEQIGTSHEGRPIMAVRLTGRGWQPGMARVVMNHQLHAREWIAGMSGVYAVEQACQKASKDASWLSGVEVVIVPMSNPDGFLFSESNDRFWRKNRKVNSGTSCMGVDLNRNWEPEWGGASGSKCSNTYYGPSAYSEPETQAIKDLLDEAPNSIHLDVHAYAEMILAPWSYEYAAHPRRSEIDVSGRLMQDAIQSVHGKRYQYGGSEILSAASGVAPDYSTMTGAWGFTLELSPGDGNGGFAPPASLIQPTVEECWAAIAAAIKWSKSAAPPTTPAPTPAPEPTPAPYCHGESSGPDSDGDCKCNSGTKCYEDGSYRCTFSSTARYGSLSTRYFLPSCSGCQCQSR